MRYFNGLNSQFYYNLIYLTYLVHLSICIKPLFHLHHWIPNDPLWVIMKKSTSNRHHQLNWFRLYSTTLVPVSFKGIARTEKEFSFAVLWSYLPDEIILSNLNESFGNKLSLIILFLQLIPTLFFHQWLNLNSLNVSLLGGEHVSSFIDNIKHLNGLQCLAWVRSW